MKQSKLSGIPVGVGAPVRIMGVINVSPESFFKGSVPSSEKALLKTLTKMEKDGADFIDVGAMSSAPYLKTIISEEEETKRLVTTIKLIKKHSTLPISVDSWRARPAQAALECGAKILNDITGLNGDPDMVDVAKKAAGVILMAHPSSPILIGNGYDETSPSSIVKKILKYTIDSAVKLGVAREKIVVDPGIGFFRETEIAWWKWDVAVLNELEKISKMDRPVLIGVSRKSFIGEILRQKNPENRLAGSLAATTIALLKGAAIVRTHDVKETAEVIRLVSEVSGGVRSSEQHP